MGRQDLQSSAPMTEDDPLNRGALPLMENHQGDNFHSPPRVYWRAETSFSEAEEEEEASSGDDYDDVRSESSSSLSSSGLQVVDPISSKAATLRRRCNHNNNNEQSLLEEVVPVKHQKSYTVVAAEDTKNKNTTTTDVYVEVDLEQYMASREMTPLQERVNALTMIPQPIFCLCFLLSGNWISKSLLEETMEEMQVQSMTVEQVTTAFEANETCLDWSNNTSTLPGWIATMFENFHALPPLPIMAIVLGVVIHAPWSFLYHWKYAHALSPTKRTDHWSRRMDQAMLHVSSALTSFGTCGVWDGGFVLLNVIFNADSFYRQFLPEVKPKRNQNRLGIAIVAWTLPILKRGDYELFLQVFLTLAVGIFLFVRYPIGGWSHAAFHFTLLPLMPMLMEVGTSLPASQESLKGAAQCYALAQQMATFA